MHRPKLWAVQREIHAQFEKLVLLGCPSRG